MIIILCHYVCHQVAKELHSRADKNEPDKHDFIKLASRVEEFTLRFLDPLKYKRVERQRFFDNPQTEVIVETAIRLKQKKVIVKYPLLLYVNSLKISYQNYNNASLFSSCYNSEPVQLHFWRFDN